MVELESKFSKRWQFCHEIPSKLESEIKSRLIKGLNSNWVLPSYLQKDSLERWLVLISAASPLDWIQLNCLIFSLIKWNRWLDYAWDKVIHLIKDDQTYRPNLYDTKPQTFVYYSLKGIPMKKIKKIQFSSTDKWRRFKVNILQTWHSLTISWIFSYNILTFLSGYF